MTESQLISYLRGKMGEYFYHKADNKVIKLINITTKMEKRYEKISGGLFKKKEYEESEVEVIHRIWIQNVEEIYCGSDIRHWIWDSLHWDWHRMSIAYDELKTQFRLIGELELKDSDSAVELPRRFELE